MRTKTADSYNESLQKMGDEFMEETGKDIFTTKEIAVWAIQSGRWEPPPDLVLKKCRQDFARAFRDEHHTNENGATVRTMHVARIITGDVQQHLWADIRNAPHPHIEASFEQREKLIAGECKQLNRDNMYYREIHPDRPEIQLRFDYRDEVEEDQFSGEYPPKKPR